MTTSEDDIKKLKVIYDKVEEMLKCEDYDEDLQSEFFKACPNYMDVLQSARRDLMRNDCGIVVTGETSAGKTTLMNVLVGRKKLFRSATLATTANIIRVRNAEDLCIKAFTKDEILKKEERFTDMKAFRTAIGKLTDLEQLSDEMKDIHYVDVYLPVPILKGNIIIVDTPGVGENEELDKMLLEFLQHAVSFVFIVNARNAGGIKDDRLGKIVQSVMENRLKMPCFDIMDVLFLTNQWDIVGDDSDPDSSDDDGNDVEIVWKKIQKTISEIWRGLPLENIFQISLKQVQKGVDTKFTDEFRRFESKLKETIHKNKNKRVQFYLQFIQTFQQKAILGTLARLKLLERSEDQQKELMRENLESVRQLEEECRKWRAQMQTFKSNIIDELATKLYDFINSSKGSDEILNPPGEQDIGKVSLKDVSDEVRRRIEKGISNWCQKQEAKDILEKADVKIKEIVLEIESQIRVIEINLIGIDAVRNAEVSGAILGLGITLGFLALPFSVVLSFVIAFVFVPLVALWGWFIGEDGIRVKARECYTKSITDIKVYQLKEGFEKSFGKEFDKVVLHIFDDAVPKKIESILATSKKLEKEYQAIKAKQDSILRMKRRITYIGNDVEKFRRCCSSHN